MTQKRSQEQCGPDKLLKLPGQMQGVGSVSRGTNKSGEPKVYKRVWGTESSRAQIIPPHSTACFMDKKPDLGRPSDL